MNLPEVIAAAVRTRVVQIAKGLLGSQISVIEASRELSRLRFEVCSDPFDSDFLPFVGIDSETDALPIGSVRELWAADALRAKDIEIQRAEEFYRDVARDACRKLVKRFEGMSNEALPATLKTGVRPAVLGRMTSEDDPIL